MSTTKLSPSMNGSLPAAHTTASGHNTSINDEGDKPIRPIFGFISQASCYLHRYTRNDSDAHIVERADRLRSVFMGVAIAHARLSSTRPDKGKGKAQPQAVDVADLEQMLGGMQIGTSKDISEDWPFSISSTSRKIPLRSRAVQFAHGTEYCDKLQQYILNVKDRHAAKESEVPEPLSQGDLYLCQESLEALEGALGACCEAVDQICREKSPKASRRFVSIRPPGHHCESEQPMGFCWLNNVAVAAAHAHLEHGIDRVLIFDIDLHHGNGTQEIAWRLNALAHKAIQDHNKPASPRKGSPKKTAASAVTPPAVLQMYYGSLHDIDSYPCEEMDPQLIANASVNISGGGGSQYITNVHLEPYDSLEDFHSRLYPEYHARLVHSARRFLRQTKAEADKTLVIISAGFDASEHEYASMSRHGAKVPTSFFSRFARDAVAFADAHAGGKLMAVLEGGYSQRALLSGAGSLISGLAEAENLSTETIDDWWRREKVEAYEKALAPVVSRGRKASPSKAVATSDGDWREPTLAMFSRLVETLPAKPVVPKTKEKTITPPSSNLRATRSRYNSPAVAVKGDEDAKGPISVPVNDVLRPVDSAPITPITSPLTAKVANPAVLRPATPLIRFTFKAGEQRQDPKLEQPSFTAGPYRDLTGSEDPSTGDNSQSTSD